MTSICNCDTVYKIIGTKNLQKLHKNNPYDYMMLSCECCKKYRDYFYQNYIKCYGCFRCYCKDCDKEYCKQVYSNIETYDDVLDELVCFHSYKILGVNKTSNKEEILKAYRKSYIYLFPNKGLTKEMNDHNEKIDKAFKKLNI
jgi:DnaJ-class molecular chaperone